MVNQDKLVTGNKKLDFEHQQILSVLIRLQEPELSTHQRILICEKLLHYVSEHIEEEEEMMYLYNYPDVEKHTDNHTYIQKQTLEAFAAFIKADVVSTKIIYDIFHDHIIDYDMPMVEYINKQKEI